MESIRGTILRIGLVTAIMLPVAWQAAEAVNLAVYKWSAKPDQALLFPKVYTDVPGVLTFRGNGERAAPSYGTVSSGIQRPIKLWELKTSSSSWGGGAGWTGQPAIVRWKPEVLRAMNVKEKFRDKLNFTEVIYGSLDGYVYFLDLETGEESRPKLKVGNPIKGSVSVDARGYPLLYVGEGIPENGTIGFNLFSLIDQKRLFRLNGIDSFAYRNWGAFDSSALFNRLEDALIVGGENGMFLNVKLNTAFDADKKKLTIKPKVSKYRYKIAGNAYQGIENSVAVWKHLAFFADNGGSLQAIDLQAQTPLWSLPASDDTDATIVVEEENGTPFLYTGTEVDKQGTSGNAILRKINGLTGQTVWEKKYKAYSQLGEHPVNGGLLATPVLGKREIAGLVIYTIARYGSFSGGLIAALDKKTGNEAWRLPMKSYAWSSPVDVYEANGKAYLVQADSVGTLSVVSAKDGKVVGSASVGVNIEASPAIFDDYMVVASRGGKIYGFKLQ